MARLFPFALALLALVAGCVSAPTAPQAPRCRPQVAVVPVVNRTNAKLPWDLEAELTDDILDHLMCEGTFWVSPFNQFEVALEQTKGRDYFGSDLSFANHFSHNDFLIIAELVEHEMKPYKRELYPDIQVNHTPDRHQVLAMSIRLRVIDLRHEEPLIVRQEIVDSYKLVSPKAAKTNYAGLNDLVPEYGNTPLANGHKELAGEVASKIEEAVCCTW